MSCYFRQRLCHLGCICALLLCCRAAAQPTIPNTPAGQAFGEWLAAQNTADTAQIQAFARNYHVEMRPAEVLAVRWTIGGYDLLRIERDEESILVALLKERETDRAIRLEVNVVRNHSTQKLNLHGRVVPLPPELAPTRLDLKHAVIDLTDRARDLCAEDRFSGALLVAKGDKVLLRQSCGLANRETKTPVSIDTQFRVGSLNKMFTAIAVLQLIESNKLALSDSVGRILPDYPNRDLASKVTVRHLLTHTAGTGDIFGSKFDAHRTELKDHQDYIRLYGTRDLEYQPGTKAEYSNYGYVLLGAIIEKISGQSYYDYVRQAVFGPAGMVSTGSMPESVLVPRRAVGYMRLNDAWVSNATTLPLRGTAAGGGYTTVDDLLRFARALQAGKLISKRMLDEATKPQNLDGWCGYGFMLQGEREWRSYGHGGGAPGMNADFRIFPQLGYILIGLSNLDPPAASRLVEYFAIRMPVDLHLHSLESQASRPISLWDRLYPFGKTGVDRSRKVTSSFGLP
jgi:D-alanyl-D-alanine carboxypeptidase